MTDDKYRITQRDLENPQRFIGEGLGAPEAKIVGGSNPKKVSLLHCVSKRNI